MERRDRFLAEVADQLALPDELRADILEELSAHVGDTISDLVATGRAPEAAEAEALARFGSPADLARALMTAHRGRTQVLAAAGAGTWAAIRSGTGGAVFGWLLVVVATILGTAVAQAVVGWLGLAGGNSWTAGWTAGWNTVLTAAGLAVGAFVGGSAAVRAVALRGWRTPAEVRAWVAVIGGLVVAILVLVLFEVPLNWASVMALLGVPLCFAAGARFERIEFPSLRVVGVLLAATLALVLGGSVAMAATGNNPTSYSWSDIGHGYEMIAPWWQDPAGGQTADFPSGGSGGIPGVQHFTLDAASPAVIAQFRDFRLEAWRAEPPGNGWRLVPGQSAPYAVAPASASGTTVSGTLRFNQVPGVAWAQVVVTAIGPDGRRYLLTASGLEQTEFVGSVWSWFAALGR